MELWLTSWVNTYGRKRDCGPCLPLQPKRCWIIINSLENALVGWDILEELVTTNGGTWWLAFGPRWHSASRVEESSTACWIFQCTIDHILSNFFTVLLCFLVWHVPSGCVPVKLAWFWGFEGNGLARLRWTILHDPGNSYLSITRFATCLAINNLC